MHESWRAILIEHIDGPVPINRRADRDRLRHMAALISAGYLREGHPRTTNCVRPLNTYMTEKGRHALCRALADWADFLSLRADRLAEALAGRSDPGKPLPVPEPAE